MSQPSRGRKSAFAVTTAVALGAALALPATGVADGASTVPGSQSITIDGPKVKGFKFVATASKIDVKGSRGFSSFSLGRGNAAANEQHMFSENGKTTMSVASSLAKATWKFKSKKAMVNLKFKPTKGTKNVKPGKFCKGSATKTRSGVVRGTLRIDMGKHFKVVSLKSAPAVVTRTPKRKCDFSRGPGAGQEATLLFSGNFTAARFGGKTTYSAYADDEWMFRSINIQAKSGDSFSVAGDAKTAVAKVSGLISGDISYASEFLYDGGSSGKVTGQMVAKFATGDVILAKTGDQGTVSVPGFVAPPPPNQLPSASFSYYETYNAPGEVAFQDYSNDSDGSIVGWSWNFGDGNTSSAAAPTHTYASPGTYTVMLTVTDDKGGQATESQQVVVNP